MLRSMSHITKNLRSHLVHATDEQREMGLAWYPVAKGLARDFAKRFERPVSEVCSIMAGLSPQCTWERTLVRTEEYLRTGRSPGLKLATGGLKVTAFAECILTAGETDVVCVDRHMFMAAAFPAWLTTSLDDESLKTLFDSPPRIRNVQRGVRILAEEVSLWPAQVQSIIWVTRRRSAD